jgi:predicted HTH transcriptional regulator
MTREALNNLIEQWENAKVDFKREWYWNDNIPKDIKEVKKNELVKDLIALTNGDVYSTDKIAYLILGIDDKTRELYDFDKSTILPLDKLKQQLLTLLNNYAQPDFLALDIELVDEILIISIPPRGSLISLSKDLKLKNNNTDKKGTTYYRVGEDIRVASSEVVGEFEKAFGNDKQSVSITIHGDVKGVVNAESGSVIHQTIS